MDLKLFITHWLRPEAILSLSHTLSLTHTLSHSLSHSFQVEAALREHVGEVEAGLGVLRDCFTQLCEASAGVVASATAAASSAGGGFCCGRGGGERVGRVKGRGSLSQGEMAV